MKIKDSLEFYSKEFLFGCEAIGKAIGKARSKAEA